MKTTSTDRWLRLGAHWGFAALAAMPRILFLAQHEPDERLVTLWYLGSTEGGAATAPDGMVVFGFGRGPGTRPLFRGAGQRFTVGLLETAVADADDHARVAEKITAAVPDPGGESGNEPSGRGAMP